MVKAAPKGNWVEVEYGWVLTNAGYLVGLVSTRHRGWLAFRRGENSERLGRGWTPKGCVTGEADLLAVEECLERHKALFDLKG